jgi:ribosomal protein S18 acetylase RimI-like enzyme
MRFCAGAEDSASMHEWLTSLLATGTTRPEWCWAASRGGSITERQVWWAAPGAAAPLGVDLVTTTDRGSGRELLVRTRARLGLEQAIAEVHAPITEPAGPAALRTVEAQVLEEAGFSFEVARVSVECTPATAVRAGSPRLTFQPASEVGTPALVALFAAVGQGSLDHGMAQDRARLGVDGEAAARLARARGYRAKKGWFHIGRDESGSVVGYVVPGLAGATPMIAEIGVSAAHRGMRYVDDLLAEGTGVLLADGAERIVADTDVANLPMRAAFRRGGYREYRWRDDFRWSSS